MNYTARQIVSSWREERPTLSNLPFARINHITASQSTKALLEAASNDPTAHAQLMDHVMASRTTV